MFIHVVRTTLHVTEGIALERESLIKQLNLLRSVKIVPIAYDY